jgi:ribosomal protein S27AE
MSGYPPGVTGNEYEITGPDFTGDEPRPCPDCGGDTAYEVGYQGARWWECSECGYTSPADAE